MLLATVSLSLAAQFTLQIDTGRVFMHTPSIGSWGVVGNGTTVAIGDSLRLAGVGGVSLELTQESRLILHDSCILAVTGSEGNPVFALTRGEIFLDRSADDRDFNATILAQGCTFAPEGTAFAVKITPRGDPSVAVIRGKVQASDPAGQTMAVTAGNYATFEIAARSFRKGALPPQAIQRLESWSATQHEPYVEEQVASGEQPPRSDEGVAENGSPDTSPAQEPAVDEEVIEPREQKVMQMEQPAQTPVQKAQTANQAEVDQPQEKQATNAPASNETPAAAAEPEKEKPQKAQQETAKKTTSKPSSQTADQGGSVNDAAQKAQAASKDDPAEEPEAEGQAAPSGDNSPSYELSTGMVTVDDEQWTRIAFMIDVPIWRFGVAFDLELFLDSKGQFSDKSWDFTRDGWAESLARKIRYIRFNRDGDPVFVKLGALDNVTMGYGFIVDRFTNMLNYPDEKLIGLQFDLNDISPIGITLETMVADFLDFRDDGGVLATRLGLRPLKPTNIPILSGLLVAGTYATDLNQYAPARNWDYTLNGDLLDRDEDSNIDSTFWYNYFEDEEYFDELADGFRGVDSVWDPKIEHTDQWASSEENQFSIIGGDLSIPLISSKLVGLDIYGQGAMTYDDEDGDVAKGWGIGAPGAKLTVGPLWAQAEYRRVEGEFQPGYFGPYYLEQRIRRNPSIVIKEDLLEDADLNGIFGSLGFNIASIFVISGTYQNLLSPEDVTNAFGDRIMDQRFEMTANIGDVLLERIPKVSKAEAFLYKSGIMRTVMNEHESASSRFDPDYDGFFEKTPNMYWGYRLGAEVMSGASVIWETRYGWEFDENNNLTENNTVLIQAGLAF